MGEVNNYPRLHNAAWPGVVGKGSPGADPVIGLDEMLDLTAAATVNGIKFDGVDLFLAAPHVDIDSSDDDLKRLAEKVTARGLVIGSVVAPVWAPAGGGSAIGGIRERARFLSQVEKACRIGRKLRELHVRPYGIVRVDTAEGMGWFDGSVEGEWHRRWERAVETLHEACDIAVQYGERLAAEGEICWAFLHNWRDAVRLLEAVGEPKVLGFQADMAHTLLFLYGYNAPLDCELLKPGVEVTPAFFGEAYRTMTKALRPWTIDFHVAQNDGTVKGSGTHDKTGRHCLPNDPNGKLNIPHHAGFWLRDQQGGLTKACRHICWDGCMFPDDVMRDPDTWTSVLSAMIAVRREHGWPE
ncbi:MAG: TIM barrel protein [Patescibacteria group bacterium]|nr:TIM barrel protein [Patescibacteria group bacterium]